MKSNSNTVELTVHASCYWRLRFTLCYSYQSKNHHTPNRAEAAQDRFTYPQDKYLLYIKDPLSGGESFMWSNVFFKSLNHRPTQGNKLEGKNLGS